MNLALDKLNYGLGSSELALLFSLKVKVVYFIPNNWRN